MTSRARLLMIAPLLSVLLSGGAAQAALPDPTRPPPGLEAAPTPPPPPRSGGTGSAESPVHRTTPPPPLPRVQAVQHPTDVPLRSATALIDDRLVRVGDRLGEATVQEIRPDGVWLRLPRGGTQWLGLYAMVERQPPEQNAPRKEP